MFVRGFQSDQYVDNVINKMNFNIQERKGLVISGCWSLLASLLDCRVDIIESHTIAFTHVKNRDASRVLSHRKANRNTHPYPLKKHDILRQSQHVNPKTLST